jgi:Zn-dependent protease
MGWSLTIGTVAGTAVRLHFTFLLFLAWIGISYYMAGGPQAALDIISFFVLLFLCVVLHEFGHIFMARRFGVKTPEVILSPIGGIANMERIPEDPVQELQVAIAGPLVNVVIAALLMLGFGIGIEQLRTFQFDTASLAERLAFVNVMLVLFNLIPAFPMDGGRVLRAVLAMNMAPLKATEYAARIGQAFAFLFVLVGLLYINPILLLVGFFIYFAAAGEEQQATFQSFAKGLTVGDAMEAQPATLPSTARLTDAVDALLAASQHEFPVIGGNGEVAGLLDRDALLAGLRDAGPQAQVAGLMRDSAPFRASEPLVAAFEKLRGSRRKAEAVVDSRGNVIGLLTMENITEMMMIESARPGWRFAKPPSRPGSGGRA